MSHFFKALMLISLFTACGDKTIDRKSTPPTTSPTPEDISRDEGTPPPDESEISNLGPSKLEWDASSLKGNADFMIVPMD